MPTDQMAPRRQPRGRRLLLVPVILGAILAAAFADTAMASSSTDPIMAGGATFATYYTDLHHYRLRGHNLAADGCGGG